MSVLLYKASVTDSHERLASLMNRIEPRLGKTFIKAVKKAEKSLPVTDIERLISLGQTDQIVDKVATEFNFFTTSTKAELVYSGSETAIVLGDILDVTVSFDQVNERAVQMMRGNDLRMIREFTTGQRNAVRAAQEIGIRQGLNPRDQARMFRECVGLTERQTRAVSNYRNLLETGNRGALDRALRDRRYDRTVDRFIREGRPLSGDQIDSMVGRYRERYVKYRSETIARTEGLRVVHQGNDEMYRQAIESGNLKQDQLQQEWIPSRDDRVRGYEEASGHANMRVGIIDFGGMFVSGWGNQLRYPGDPDAPGSETIQCRCGVTTRIKMAA